MAQEAFSRTRTPAETLSKLASFIARAENKQPRNQRPQQQHLPDYVCQECGSGFSYATELLQHQDAKHSLPKPHRCPFCRQEFSLRSSLLLHKCEQSANLCALCPGQLHLCSPCHSQCTTALSSSDPASQLQDSASAPCSEQPLLLDSTPYACAPCGRGFSHKQALLHHQQAGCSEPPSPSHTVDTSCLPSDSPPPSEVESDSSDAPACHGGGARCVCQLCSRSFGSWSQLKRHRETSHKENSHKGNSHRKTRGTSHRIGSRKNKIEDCKRAKCGKKKLLKCRSCDMVFRSVSQLCLHRKEKHSRENNCIREVKPLATRSRRKGTYPCQVCGKVLFHHLSLKAHYRQHTVSSVNSRSQSSTQSVSNFRPNKVESNLAKSKTFRAGPGRPRKRVTQLEDQVANQETCDEMPVTEEEEDEQEFPCQSCAEVFPSQSQLQEHEELHQSCVRRSRCSVCSCEMDSSKWAGTRRQKRLYHCVPCQQGFSALHCFLEHCQEHLRVRVEEDTQASRTQDQHLSV